MKSSKLNSIVADWQKRIMGGEEAKISFLYPYSSINLKKVKNLRKFNNNYARYINCKLLEPYWKLIILSEVMKNHNKQMINSYR